MSDKVSVVIPAYKSAGTICRALDSVLAQTVPAYEIIVVDDGSPDDQAALVERTYGDNVRLIRQPNGKTAKARNTGIEAATGDYIAFLDADDYWEPQKLERQLAVFERHPEVCVIAGNFFEEEPGAERTLGGFAEAKHARWDQVQRAIGADAFRLATLVWTGVLIVRRQALGDQRFVTGLEPAEDRDLWVRIVAQGTVYMISEPLATYVQVPGSISRTNVDRDCGNMLRVVERNAELLGPRSTRLWRSHTLYRWSACDSQVATSVPRLLKSFVLWPFPYGADVDCRPLGRIKRLVSLLASLVPLGSRSK